MAIEIRKWDAEKDLLITDQEPLISITHPYIKQYRRQYFSINTAKGFYRTARAKNEGKNEFLFDLFLYDGNDEKAILQRIVCSNCYKYHKLLFIKEWDSSRYYLIDSRGILFDFSDCIRNDIEAPRLSAEIDLDQGYYLVCDILKMHFRDKAQQTEYLERVKADSEAALNKSFRCFIRKNIHNENKYLYLTGGKSKCGMLIEHFISNGMEYELVPNLFADDETINLRIPLFGDNAKRKEVQFIAAKYRNTYAIQGVPVIEICGGMKLPYTVFKQYHHQFYLPPTKQTIVYSLINTLRSIFTENDDYTIFQQTIESILKQFEKSEANRFPNEFSDELLLYPTEIKDAEYIKEHLAYYCSLLNINSEEELYDESEGLFGFNKEKLKEAFFVAKGRYKKKMQDYETQVLQGIAAKGKKVSKWVNEGDMFSMVVKHYPDAVFQYRAEWLGMQSLDVYIPSLKVGIEYQGVQHYEPVPFFGGEEGFIKVQERDQRKAELCEQNGVILICWRYDEPISASRLKTKLKDAGITTV